MAASLPTLYSSDFCPFASRAYMAVAIKGIPHKHVEVNLGDKPAEFLDTNPAGTVPAWNDNGLKLSESLELTRYFARKYRDVGPDILPESVEDSEYHLNVALKNFDANLFRPFYGALMSTDPEVIKAKTEELEGVLEKLDAEYGKRGGPFFFGKQVTVVDISIFPFIERIQALLPHYRNWTFPEKFANVLAFEKAFREIPAIAALLGNRLRPSLDTHPFEKVGRVNYLREVYGGYASGDVKAAKAKLVGKPAPWKGKEVPAGAE